MQRRFTVVSCKALVNNTERQRTKPASVREVGQVTAQGNQSIPKRVKHKKKKDQKQWNRIILPIAPASPFTFVIAL